MDIQNGPRASPWGQRTTQISKYFNPIKGYNYVSMTIKMFLVTKMACLSDVDAAELLHIVNIENVWVFPGRSHDDAELGKALWDFTVNRNWMSLL